MTLHPATLYREIVGLTSSAPLSHLFAKAIQLSHELDNDGFKKWLLLEYNGYYNTNPVLTDEVVVPEYRTVAGQHFDEHGRVLQLDDAKLGFVNQTRLRNGVAQLEELSNSSKLLTIRDVEMINSIKKYLNVDVSSFSFTSTEVRAVLSSIRAKFIEWLATIKKDVPEVQGAQQLASDDKISPELKGLHPLIIQTSSNLYRDGYFRQAILDAYIALVQEVKEKSGRHDLDGSGLMQTVFSPKNPIIKVSDDLDEQMGYMWMFSGAIMGIRNPKAHKLIPTEDPQVAFEWLAFASTLLKVLDKTPKAS